MKHSVGSREGLYSYHQTVFGASLRSLAVTAVALGATQDQFTDAARRVLDRIVEAVKETRPNNDDGINALLAGLGSHECIDVEWDAHPSTKMDAGKVSTYNDVRLEAWQLACAEMEAARLAMQGMADAVTACETDGTDGTDDRELRLEELRRAVVAAKKAMLRAHAARELAKSARSTIGQHSGGRSSSRRSSQRRALPAGAPHSRSPTTAAAAAVPAARPRRPPAPSSSRPGAGRVRFFWRHETACYVIPEAPDRAGLDVMPALDPSSV